MRKKTKQSEPKQEYERLRALFAEADESRIALADGLLWEAAKMRCQLDTLNEAALTAGLVKVDPSNPARQRELPVSRALTKVRASYVAYIQRIKSLLDVDTEEDEDGLEDYE